MDELDTAVGQTQRVLTLKTFPLFEELAAADLAALAHNVRPRFYPARRALFRYGTPVCSMHFVLRGKVQVERDGKLKQQVGAHGVVGGLAVLAQEPGGQQAIALEDTVTLELSSEDMEDVIEDNFSILAAVLKVLAREQIRARQRLSPHAGFEPLSRGTPQSAPEPGLVEKIWQLRATMDFASTRIEALADLAQEAEFVHFAPRTKLWAVGDVADHALLLLSGTIGGSNPERKLSFELGAGSLAGGADALAGEPRWYDALALTELRALHIDAGTAFDVIEDHIEMATEMVRMFARTTRALQDRMSQLEPARPIA